uniref:HSF-type DNA-binding domain-containing protein n=1 Tax=Otus sunia TaxID=257818 RepID=A0A8C8AYM4_9STRI
MDGRVSPAVQKEIKMEPPSPETSRASDPEGSAWWPASPSPSRPGGDTGASWDAATGPLPEGNALQASVGDSWVPMTCHLLLDDICDKTSPASAQLFLEKLWRVVNSQCFQSIWWGDDGNCIVIAKNLFRTEVLGRKGPQKIFDSESMRGFILQLNLHGFCKMEKDSIISISIEELQAVAAAGPDLGKLLFYHNPLFNRDDPDLLRSLFAQRAGGRRRAPAAPPRGPDMEEECPRKRRRPEAQPAVGAAQEDNHTRPWATTSSTATEPWAGTTAPRGSAAPPPPKRRCSHSPAGTQEAAPAPATASPHPLTPPAPANSPRAPAWPFSASP